MGNCSCATAANGPTGELVVASKKLQIGRKNAWASKGLGWTRDTPDFRDRVLDLPAASKENLPTKVDLRPQEHCPVYDQGHLNSCTAQAVAGAFHFAMMKEGMKVEEEDFRPSRLFIYYNERDAWGISFADVGAMLRDGIKSVAKQGCCSETVWPYDPEKVNTKPSDKAFELALETRAVEYASIPNTLEDKKGILAQGYPFVLGFLVCSSFQSDETAKTGMMTMPTVYEQIVGGHGVLAVGYDDDKQCFLIRNSWGEDWGIGGYFWMPYDIMTHPIMVQDCWAINFVKSKQLPTKAMTQPAEPHRKLGWKADKPDDRDLVLNFPAHKKEALPDKVDLRPQENFEVYDQGHLGSCTANAIGGAFHFAMVKEGLKVDWRPSRLFVYYNERDMEGTVGTDSGAQIRDGIKSVATLGVCSETEWPYKEETFTTKPSSACYSSALKDRAVEYARVPQTEEDMKACLAEGFPFVFGFMVFSSFMSEEVAKTGVMAAPSLYDKLCGGHAVMAVGYDDERKVFIVRNSWGEGWGDKGYFYMPYDYMTNSMFVQDPWTIKFVEGKQLPTKALKN